MRLEENMRVLPQRKWSKWLLKFVKRLISERNDALMWLTRVNAFLLVVSVNIVDLTIRFP